MRGNSAALTGCFGHGTMPVTALSLPEKSNKDALPNHRIDWNVPVHGICVRRNAQQQYDRIFQRATEINSLLSQSANISQADILVDDTVLHPGYGQLNEGVMTAITDSAQLEALLLDPVYSGRTMAGLISLVEQGIIKKGERVLFIHTGGLPSIFAYETDLMQGLSSLTAHSKV